MWGFRHRLGLKIRREVAEICHLILKINSGLHYHKAVFGLGLGLGFDFDLDFRDAMGAILPFRVRVRPRVRLLHGGALPV